MTLGRCSQTATTVEGMLNIRLEGDLREAEAFLKALQVAGVEVQRGTTKARQEGFHHVYATVRVPGYREASGPALPPLVVEVPAVEGRRRRAIGGPPRVASTGG